MDNILPPLTGNTVIPPTADKGLSGVLEELPVEVKNQIQSGDSLLLKILAESGTPKLGGLSGRLMVLLKGTPAEIPVSLKLNQPVVFPRSEEVNLQLKAQPGVSGLRVQINAVNGQPPEKYFAAPARPVLSRPDNSAVINETGGAWPKTELNPLRLDSFVEKMGNELKLPPQVVKAAAETFRNSFGELAPLSVNVSPEETAFSRQTVDLALQNIKQAVQTFIDKNPAVFADKDLGRLTDFIKGELSNLTGLRLPAEVRVFPETNFVVLKTPLGEVLPQTPLKLENGALVVLEVKKFMETTAENLLRAAPLPGMTELSPARADRQPVEELDNLLKILEPLKAAGQAGLAAEIVGKLPAADNKMIANMLTYMKALNQRSLTAWLGSELAEKMAASPEGKEAAARLGNLFTAPQPDSMTWRIMEIPYFTGAEISKIRVAVKKLAEEEQENNKRRKQSKYGTRFVVDTVFTKLGGFQFDGYSLEKDRRFDLVVRTEKTIGDDLVSAMMRLFKTTLSGLDYNGTIRVNVKEKFIKICEDKSAQEFLKDGIYI